MAKENVNELLCIEESSKVSQLTTDAPEVDNFAEKTLTIIATSVLCVGIICTIICICVFCANKNFVGLVVLIGLLVLTLTTWSLLKVIANISKTLKEINFKIK